MNKKALAVEAWAAIILALLLGAGLGMITYKYLEMQSITGKIEKCHASLLFFKQAKYQAGELGISPKVDCTVIKEEINENKKEQAMLAIAEQLRLCWYKTLGKDNSIGVDFLESSLLPRQVKELDVDFCLVCSEFTVNQDISHTEMQTFLNKRFISNSKPRQTYTDYLDTSWKEILKTTSKSTQPILIHPKNSAKLEYTDLEKEDTYYIMSLNAAESEGYEEYAGGIRSNYNQVFIIPKKEISKIKCGIFHYQEE